MKFQFVKGETSVILIVFIQNSSLTTGAGLGSLDENSSIVGGYVKRNGLGVALAVDENVTTEGTYEAPTTAGQVRIGTPANMRTGVYELHFHNDLFTTADYLTIVLGGATNMAELPIEVQLTSVDLNDAVRGGMSALPAAAADAAGGLVISDLGGLDMDALNTAAVRLTAVRAAVLTDWIDGGRLDLILDAIAADVVNLDGAAMRGTDGAALASVLGALADVAATGDPTAVDTVMQYLKQLVNLLAGSDGIATMPAGADPANGINLFEMLRGALGATFAGATDSQEAIRNRGDAAWITAPNDPTAAAIADAVWDELRAAHVIAGSFGQGVASVQGNVTGSVASVTGAVGSVTGNVGGNVVGDVQGNVDGSVASVTAGVLVGVGGIAATAFAANAITAAALAQDAAQEIADEILNRNLAGGGSGDTRNVRNALRALRNRVAIVAGTATVFQEDDATTAWTAAITTAAGDPISEVDPAGP